MFVNAAKKDVTNKQKTVEWPYKNAQLPVSERVNDLLSRMTLEEKVGQTLCIREVQKGN